MVLIVRHLCSRSAERLCPMLATPPGLRWFRFGNLVLVDGRPPVRPRAPGQSTGRRAGGVHQHVRTAQLTYAGPWVEIRHTTESAVGSLFLGLVAVSPSGAERKPPS